MAFIIRLYWNSFALLVEAELDAELAKASVQGQLSQKLPRPSDAAERAA